MPADVSDGNRLKFRHRENLREKNRSRVAEISKFYSLCSGNG